MASPSPRNSFAPPASSSGQEKHEDGLTTNYTQYVSSNGLRFIPYKSVTTYNRLPAGCYRLSFNSNTGEYYVNFMRIEGDGLLELPVKVMYDVLDDIKKFWKRKAKFKEYNLVYKRGILLHGPPGSGKTNICQLVKKKLIEEQDGVVFTISNHEELQVYSRFMKECFVEIEPHRPIVTIIEDIDGLTRHNDTETELLQVLDGAKQMNNIVYLATTNYPENLAERILNRPSRFDRVYEVGYPSPKVREFYFRSLILEKDMPKVDMDAWLVGSQGFTFAHMRDMVVSVLILGNTLESTVTHLQGMKNLPTSKKTKGGGVGFGKADGSPQSEMEYYIPVTDDEIKDYDEDDDLPDFRDTCRQVNYDEYNGGMVDMIEKMTSALSKRRSGGLLSNEETELVRQHDSLDDSNEMGFLTEDEQ